VNSPLWFGDEIGVMPAEGRADLTTTSLTKIEYGLCSKHGQHVLFKWNNGDVALGTLQADGFWLAEEDDLPRSQQESEMGRKVVQEIITRELESALAG
jgi:hypothetical protein